MPGDDTSSEYCSKRIAKLARYVLAESKINAAGTVDEEANGAGGRPLERDQLDVGVERPDAILDRLLQLVARSQFGPLSRSFSASPRPGFRPKK